MNNPYSKLLADYILTHFVSLEQDENATYEEARVNHLPTINQLLNLEALVEAAINERKNKGEE